MIRLSHRLPLLAAAASLAALPLPAAASDKGWDTASTIGVGALAAWSLGVPAKQGDGRGAAQAAGSVAAAYAVASGLKEAFPEARPDGSDRRSFPSGHTAAAFAAASSILERRGAGEGVPALVAASFVGFARVKAHKHHWYDAVAGAAIGTGTGLIVTHPLADRRVALAPWADSTGGGANVVFAF